MKRLIAKNFERSKYETTFSIRGVAEQPRKLHNLIRRHDGARLLMNLVRIERPHRHLLLCVVRYAMDSIQTPVRHNKVHKPMWLHPCSMKWARIESSQRGLSLRGDGSVWYSMSENTEDAQLQKSKWLSPRSMKLIRLETSHRCVSCYKVVSHMLVGGK